MSLSLLRVILVPALSATLLAALVSLILWFSQIGERSEKQTRVRSVNLAAPPPPPPPAMERPNHSQVEAPTLQLTAQGSGVAIEFAPPSLEVPSVQKALPEVKLATADPNLLDTLAFDWHAFGLGDLDETPRLLTQLKVRFPQQLRRQGVKLAEIELDVMIDEKGHVLLRRVVQNQHPELLSTIENLVKKARFTIPRKDGVAVRAAFNWPLEFADS